MKGLAIVLVWVAQAITSESLQRIIPASVLTDSTLFSNLVSILPWKLV